MTRRGMRVLEAAHAVLAEIGPNACMEQIAARAGVGVGSVYRRFPSKEALVEALVQRVVDQIEGSADRALAGEAATGLESFLRELGALYAEHHRYAALTWNRDRNAEGNSAIRPRFSDFSIARSGVAGRLLT